MNLNVFSGAYKLKIDSGYDIIKDYFEMVFSFLSDSITKSIDVLSGNDDSLKFDESIITSVSSVIENVAVAILGLLLAVELINKLTEKGEDFRYTDAAFTGIKYSLILAIVNQSSTLMTAIAATGSSMVIGAGKAGGLINNSGAATPGLVDKNGVATSGVNSITELGNQFVSLLKSDDGLANLMGNLSVFLTSLLPTIILLLCSFIIVVIAFARFIEIKTLSILSPIAYSFLSFRGTSDVPKRFTFTYASVCLQAFVMVLCLVLFISLQNAAFNEFETATKAIEDGTDAYVAASNSFKFSTIVNSILLVFSTISSGRWARSVFGL